jgi:threonine/homoserine/homoserine lactone efflux protein
MEPVVFLKGLIIGFAMGVPIGPAGILCIRKTLAEGHSRGLIIGLGAATADALCGSLAAFGLTVAVDVIASHQLWIRLAGGVLLLIVGVRTFRAERKDLPAPVEKKGLWGSYVTAVLLGITNPVTVFAFMAVFAAFGLGHRLADLSACIPVFGVFAGSCLWFLTLGYLAAMFRKMLDAGGLTWVNRLAGVLIILSGVAAFISII